jgi:uncharacterized protein YqeY
MITLKEKIQQHIKECMLNGNVEIKELMAFERDTLRTVLGEAQRKSINPSDEDIIAVLKKSKQGCIETRNHIDTNEMISLQDAAQKRHETNCEIDIYDRFLPSVLSLEEIIEIITKENYDSVVGAKSDGQATGIAIGTLKKMWLSVDGKDVAAAVKQIRS